MTDDPNEQSPHTRRMDPIDPNSIDPDSIAPDPGYAAGYPEPDYGQPSPAPTGGSGSGRTAMLWVIIALALALVLLAGYLLFASTRGADDDAGGAAPVSSPTTTTSTTTSSATTSATTSTSEHTRPTAAPGAVTYQFTGGGSVIGIRYTDANGVHTLAGAGAPWSVRTTVDGVAELTAIVVTGPVTCTILHGEELLASSTSHGGPIACRAAVPN